MSTYLYFGLYFAMTSNARIKNNTEKPQIAKKDCKTFDIFCPLSITATNASQACRTGKMYDIFSNIGECDRSNKPENATCGNAIIGINCTASNSLFAITETKIPMLMAQNDKDK